MKDEKLLLLLLLLCSSYVIMYKLKNIVLSKEVLALQIIVLSKEVLALQTVKPINCMLHAYCCNYTI